jgi:hypothetical protein
MSFQKIIFLFLSFVLMVNRFNLIIRKIKSKEGLVHRPNLTSDGLKLPIARQNKGSCNITPKNSKKISGEIRL